MPYRQSNLQRILSLAGNRGCDAALCVTDTDEKTFKAVTKMLANA